MQLDYNLKTVEERIAFVENLLTNTPNEQISKQHLSYMSDYILFIADKDQTKKEREEDKPIITRNREMTVSKRQVSYEEIVASLENGEDGLHTLIRQDKNQLLDNRSHITQEDIDEVPGLREQLQIIDKLKNQFNKATTGAQKYSLKRQIIETWQQIYILKASFRNAPVRGRASNQLKTMAHMRLDEEIWLDENDNPQTNAILTLINPNHVSFLLCYYSQLKQECADDLDADMHFLLMDLDELADAALEKYPELYDLLVWKIDGYTNEEIQQLMLDKYNKNHQGPYFSNAWRKKIPQLIADAAKKKFLTWYFTNVEYGQWKKCSKCGEIKLAHNMFFAKNSTKDGWYSQCKDCKNGRS